MTKVADWQKLPIKLSERSLAEVLDGGQAFRWNQVSLNHWKGIWRHHVVEIQRHPTGHIEWRPLTQRTVLEDLLHYLGSDDEWAERADTLPWRSDSLLAKTMDAFPGLRILRQPFGETLLAFLCSSNKQIPQIKAMLAALAQHGAPLTTEDRGLPDWNTLATLTEETLRACKLGYRARYISETARLLQNQPDWEEHIQDLPYDEAHRWLCTLPGVGPKVADCVLLFGAGKLEAFPIDTWIHRILSEGYGLTGWNPKQLTTFARIHFGPLAGLAQQYLFAAARLKGRESIS